VRAEEHDEYTAAELSRATRRLDMALAEWHGELGQRMNMGTSEILALARLAMDDSQGPSELARSLHMTTGAMTAVLDRLAERGHIEREQHPSDRRKVALRLTSSAHEAARAQVRPMVAQITELAARLSPTERAVVGRFLDDLTALVHRAAGLPQAPPATAPPSTAPQPTAPPSTDPQPTDPPSPGATR
jgi:DNA-binding MarR family transcriptional regulator